MSSYEDQVQSLGAELIGLLKRETPVLRGNLSSVVRHLLSRRDDFLKLCEGQPTPFYVFDRMELEAAVRRYQNAFENVLPGSRHFYAVKLNHYLPLLKAVVELGMGLDVSSGRELGMALECGAREIVFSGPGKSDEELALAIEQRDKVTIHLDSPRELERLGELLHGAGSIRVRAGVRVFSGNFGPWGKFGIPLGQLKGFWQRAAELPQVELCGIQFHMSWNRDAAPYVAMIAELAQCLASELSAADRSRIEFIDMGGGFRPYRSEGLYPWKLPWGEIQRSLEKAGARIQPFEDRYYLVDSVSMDEYAAGIAQGIKQNLDQVVDCTYFTEPGRVIANNAMHIMLRIVDCKRSDCAIADGGINLVGWERFEHDYFPLVNLTRPDAARELEHTIYGSLCMPQDLWGYHVYGQCLSEGDLILVPYQGALTYSLAQEFIRPIAPVQELS